MSKKPSINFLLSCLLSCSLPTALLIPSFSAFSAPDRFDYDLDDDGLIEINDLADLNEMRNDLNGKSLYGSSLGCPDDDDGFINGGCNGYELTVDLDFDTNKDGVIDFNDDYWNYGEGWIAIGSNWDHFSANFNGNNHEISNLYINQPSGSYLGLFAYTNVGTISNLRLGGAQMLVEGNTGVGALVGRAIYTEIQNVTISGEVRANDSVGGVVGVAARSVHLNQCVHQGVIQSSGDKIGGLVGSLDAIGSVTNSYNLGQVNGGRETGGLVGYAYQNAEISQSFNVGAVVGADYTGGLVGRLRSNITVANTFNTGHVSRSSSDYVGGLVGFSDSSSVVNSSFSSGKVSGLGVSGGLMGHAIDLSVRNSYWAIDTSTQDTSGATSEESSYVGLYLSVLQCPLLASTNAFNSECVSSDGVIENLDNPVTLFYQWDDNIWDFGDEDQLPALILNGVIFRDSDGDGKLDLHDASPYDHDDSTSSHEGSVPDGEVAGSNAPWFLLLLLFGVLFRTSRKRGIKESTQG